MRLHIGKAFNSLKLTDYLEEEQEEKGKPKPLPSNRRKSINSIKICR